MALFASACSAESAPVEPVAIEWFVGFGTGTRPEQLEAQQAVVDRFNESQDDIELSLTIGEWVVVYDVLAERLEAGTAPDIIGPIGLQGSGALTSEFLDLRPYVDSGQLDVDAYGPAQIAAETGEDGRITGLPFGAFPSLLFLNRQLFRDAGVPFPPQRFGEMYRGEPWDMEALRQLAIELTLDANGNTPADPAFDPDRIVQWGFHHQFLDDARAIGTFFGAGELADGDAGVSIPDAWVDSWRWYHDLIWKHRAAPNDEEITSPVLGFSDAFKSGRVAMAFTHTWYAGSMQTEGVPLDTFSFAVVPEHNGVATSKLHADTFRVFAQTDHPDEAVQVLAYLLDDAAADLLRTYGSFPARADLRSGFEAELAANHPSIGDLSVIQRSLERPDIPSHESPLPNFEQSQLLLRELIVQVRTNPDLDVDAAVAQLGIDLAGAFAVTGT